VPATRLQEMHRYKGQFVEGKYWTTSVYSSCVYPSVRRDSCEQRIKSRHCNKWTAMVQHPKNEGESLGEMEYMEKSS